jgi:NitT/TauT family transport system ATP-binding protein
VQSVKVRLEGVTRRFEGKNTSVLALDNINMTVRQGEFVVIVGPSGCGKSTLLRILSGLEQQTSGRVEIARETEERPLNTMVFQEQSVFPWLTVWENIAYGLRMRKVPHEKMARVVSHYLQKVGLSGFEKAYPYQLSGGMKQRVGVARAFASDPEILLMDEPFAALDEQNKAVLQQELLRIWEESRKAVIFITHSIDEALALADRVVVMSARPGRIKAEIAVDFPRPRRVMELRKDPRYGELVYAIWTLLHEEAEAGKGAAGHVG